MRKHHRLLYILFTIVIFSLSDSTPSLSSDFPHPKTYLPRVEDVFKAKAPTDDSRSWLEGLDPKAILPEELKEAVYFDREKMKELWEDVIGFKAPDIVGKIATEVRPGKYTYKDVENNAAMRKLIIPGMLEMFKPGGPPFSGNIAEFEIIPTRQLYWSLPIAQATKDNMGKTNLDNKGYIVEETWKGGFPFGRPDGEFRAQQYVYNYLRKYTWWGFNYWMTSYATGFDRKGKIDNSICFEGWALPLYGDVYRKSDGWYDNRAEANGEYFTSVGYVYLPRDVRGTVTSSVVYRDYNKENQSLIYVPSLRRFRKVSSTDKQLSAFGSDIIGDDNYLFNQTLHPERYPYTFEIVEDREFLIPFDYYGKNFVDSKNGYEWKNVVLERRPIVVVKMVQQDKNYVYGKRMIYFDKETFMIQYIENYDQKERLYRNALGFWYFDADMGQVAGPIGSYTHRDYIDLHSSVGTFYSIPAFYDRDDMSLKTIVIKGK